MTKTKLLTRALVAAASCAAMGSAWAAPVTWTDWTAIGAAAATGNMGGVTVSVAATAGSINGVSQTGCGTNFWTEPNALDPAYTGGSVSNAPTACEQVGLNSAVSITVTFSSAVDTLYMALLSVGQPNLMVTYDFDQAFAIDSEGTGFWGNDITNGVIGVGDTLAMKEFHGVLRFAAPVSSLSFTTAPAENWHAFTFGTVPEPGSLALVGAALLAAGALSRRKHAA